MHEKEECAYNFVHFTKSRVNGSSAQLTSFGWDRVTNNRTLLKFNLPKLKWPHKHNISDPDAWRREWLEAFNKKKLTEEFFEEFKQAFKNLQADLVRERPGAHRWAYDYALQFLNPSQK